MLQEALSIEVIMILLSVLLALSILASRISSTIGIPALLVFLSIGMLTGSEGVGGIYFDDARLSQNLGVVSLAFILFSGGFSTEWSRVRSVLWQGFSLATLGVGVSTVLVGFFCYKAFGFGLVEGMLLGAIVSSTDAAAVFAILRGKGISLRRKLTPLLELESGSNDPMAVFLTVSLTALITSPSTSAIQLVPDFFLQMAIGSVSGVLFGKLAVFSINQAKLDHEGLYPVLTTSIAGLSYGVTQQCGGNGFIAVYLTGIVLANSDFLHKRSLSSFHDGLAWLMQILMFLTLGLLVFPSRIVEVAAPGLLLALFLILIARPVSVWLSLAFSNLEHREKAMVSWIGLRGAAPIILSTFPLLAGIERAGLIFDLVFFVVLVSVLIQGPSIPWVARLLHADVPSRARSRSPLFFEPNGRAKSDLTEFAVQETSPAIGKRIVELGLRPGVLIVLIERNGEYVVPDGATVLVQGDILLLFAPKGRKAEIQAVLSA